MLLPQVKRFLRDFLKSVLNSPGTNWVIKVKSSDQSLKLTANF